MRSKNNVNTGGAYIEKDHMASFIRGEGLVKSLDDIRHIVVKNEGGVPILISDVAEEVRFGHQVRYGAFTQDGHEAVGGMILMLKGANSAKVVAAVKERMKDVQKSLPKDIQIKPFLDRSNLIERTTSTIARNLTEGALIVIFVLVLLLGSVRGGLITASVIPLSLLFAFILMRVFGVSANLMSLGAIDFGIIVDGAVIIVEGIVHKVERAKFKMSESPLDMEQIGYECFDYDGGRFLRTVDYPDCVCPHLVPDRHQRKNVPADGIYFCLCRVGCIDSLPYLCACHQRITA